MSLLLKRIYPSADDFDGNIAQLHQALMPAKVAGAKAEGQSERFIAMMDYGVTIYLPGEEPDPYTSLVDSTPYVARFGHQAKDAKEGDAAHFSIGEGDGTKSEDQARRVLKLVFRSLLRRLNAGGRLEVLPGRYWQLLQNRALAAELTTNVPEGTLLLEERTVNADKALPDAIYCLQRLAQHSYLADLLKDDPTTSTSEEDFEIGNPYSKDISLFDLHSAFGSGTDSDDLSDDDDDEPWKSE